ncbi:MAG: YHYH protein [Candidatus Kapaibacterium sp.]|nr:YHYH protein [Bacteroidota bacterium]
MKFFCGRYIVLCALVVSIAGIADAQTNPVITSWLQNTTGIKGRHYVKGNSTPINDNVLANVQSVKYSANWVYINTHGVPAYITGPFLDGNPSVTTDQNAIFKMPLNPQKNTGTASPTTMGNIGIFINGVALFDYRDGVSWQTSTNSLKGGPLMGQGDLVWNRDAVVAERKGFDCAKGHPAMGNYHHHQNPSAFKLDKNVVSTVCDLYDADGLYLLDSTKHSALIGFAYDGFPIYGAYGYKNADGTGGIVRIKSSYRLRNITVRTHYADGTDVLDGPPVNTTYPLGYFREDYEYVAPTAPDYLDEHNGRFCVTPEYPNGIYCYFTTVDEQWNSTFPYVVGPTFYGVKTAAKVNNITEQVTTYTAGTSDIEFSAELQQQVSVFPNPSNELIAVQFNNVAQQNYTVELYDELGKLINQTTLFQGSTIAYFDARTLYNGAYIVRISNGALQATKKVLIAK